jgi:guanylate kinase
MSDIKFGKMIAITAPSGAGKTTIVKHLLSQYEELAFSVSATTRAKRKKEIEGQDYYFLSKEDFEDKIRFGEFVEWEEVYEKQYYGTLRSEVERIWAEGKNVLFDIEVKGATSLKKAFGSQCLAIFIEPPSLNVLIERLKNRRTESEDSLRKRIRRVKQELGYANSFDRIIVNDILEATLKEAELITESFLGIQTIRDKASEEE